jgi:AraC family transcriptional activator FtrA
MDKKRWKSAKLRVPHRVVALAYPNLCLFEFGIAAELFGLSRPEIATPWYAFQVAGVTKSARTAIGNLQVGAQGGLDLLENADTIIVPGWSGPEVLPGKALKAAVQRADARGARFLSICSGAFLLGHCGLLDGRDAATHWRYEALFTQLFPKAHLVHDALYVESDRIITSAGSAAGIDASLHIIRQDHGSRIANQVAQRLVMLPHRQGDARQYVPAAVVERKHDRFDGIFDWARANLQRPITVDDMASVAAMSARNFHRRFSETVGVTPATWILEERLRHARTLLEESNGGLGEIAEQCGFASVETFRSAFRRRIGISPSAYRGNFGQIAPATTPL